MKRRNIPDKSRRIPASLKTATSRLNRFSFRDFSAIEDDSQAFQIIRRLASNAGNYAAAEARVRGLGTVYVRNNKLVKVFAKGGSVAVTPKINRVSFYVKYKPATILHAIKK